MSGPGALEKLMEGNARFVSGKTVSRPTAQAVLHLAAGQSPFATVLACADSRVPVEELFDFGPGDIFTIRVAGNFVTEAVLGSIEYAVAELKSPLVLVLGHTSCGAVKAALENVQKGTTFPGRIQVLADAIAPAAKAVQQQNGDRLHAAVVENVRMNVSHLTSSTAIIAPAIRADQLDVAGGVYDLSTGKVTLV